MRAQAQSLSSPARRASPRMRAASFAASSYFCSPMSRSRRLRFTSCVDAVRGCRRSFAGARPAIGPDPIEDETDRSAQEEGDGESADAEGQGPDLSAIRRRNRVFFPSSMSSSRRIPVRPRNGTRPA